MRGFKISHGKVGKPLRARVVKEIAVVLELGLEIAGRGLLHLERQLELRGAGGERHRFERQAGQAKCPRRVILQSEGDLKHRWPAQIAARLQRFEQVLPRDFAVGERGQHRLPDLVHQGGERLARRAHDANRQGVHEQAHHLVGSLRRSISDGRTDDDLVLRG